MPIGGNILNPTLVLTQKPGPVEHHLWGTAPDRLGRQKSNVGAIIDSSTYLFSIQKVHICFSSGSYDRDARRHLAM